MSLREEAGLHVLIVGTVFVVSTIRQVVFCTVVKDNEGALLTLVVDGSAIGIGNGYTIEYDGLFLRTVEFEEAVVRFACEYIFDDVVRVVGGSDVVAIDLHNAGIITADGGSARCTECDRDGLGEGGVLDIIVITTVDLDGFRDGILIDGHGERGDIAITGNTCDDVISRRGGLCVVVITFRHGRGGCR